MSTTTTVELRGLRRSRGARPRAGERHLRVVPPLDETAVARAVVPRRGGPDGRGGPGGEPRADVRPDAPPRDPAGVGSPVRPVAEGGAARQHGARTLAARLDLDGLRLTARGRFAVAVVALVLAAPVVWGATAVASSPAEPVEVRAHAVEPGETLWGLAASVAEPGQDVRDVVRQLQDLNDLTSGGLTVGQTLYVPAG
ncbi:LysM peptidoglycan-binding domain-containing protein [Myceligenerans pegani]|uniref:LysM peptidoglycan-binding domain-containing protein n=1 Tax=Myceligenerans pegani TaxID=2776917 RepID=A0ABR9MYF6_9MICO|nr:LysM peptidoglycan-binding domain-containing protein [Myceligenerans sp. TRM 65318]MBE1876421.1 LysM peptidoglycan-binding domain-containing protein [Myceligenerans sp. TRM 65318]MBE3018692.1 LysM peptidoglycan-binding domain-containing protein [Myceligenerans sp. TRM 65318]